MNTVEAKEAIKKEFMSRYEQWMLDRNDLDDYAYGRKYGWQKSEKLMSLKDNLTAVAFFQKYIFCGKTWEGWERLGIDRKAVWALAGQEGWLSVNEGHYKRPTYYYITQQRAKEIWKEAKGK